MLPIRLCRFDESRNTSKLQEPLLRCMEVSLHSATAKHKCLQSVLAAMNYNSLYRHGAQMQNSTKPGPVAAAGGKCRQKMEQLLQEKRKLAETSLLKAVWPAGETHTSQHKRFREFGVQIPTCRVQKGQEQPECKGPRKPAGGGRSKAPQLFGFFFKLAFLQAGKLTC